MDSESLWKILDLSAPSTDLVQLSEIAEDSKKFDTGVLLPVLSQAQKRIDPVALGNCLLHSAASTAAPQLLHLLGNIWRHELDLLAGLVEWLYSRNSQYSDSIIDLILANRTSEAALKCLNELKKPRLSLLIAAAASPNLTAQPRIADQLMYYRRQDLCIADVQVSQILHVLSGMNPYPLIEVQSWTQALCLVLVFELNANLLSMNLPTYADQIRIIRCALDKIVALYPSVIDETDQELQFICYIATYCISDNSPSPAEEMVVEDDADSSELMLIPEATIAIQRFADSFEEAQGSLQVLCKWLAQLYYAYNMNTDATLVEALQSTAAYIPANFDTYKTNIVWCLIRYQQTRNKSFLTRQIFADYCAAHARLCKGSCSNVRPRLHAYRAALPDANATNEKTSSDGSSGNGLDLNFLPNWFVYQCIGDEYLRQKCHLQAAAAYFKTYKCIVDPLSPSPSTDGWWGVLASTFKRPDEAECMIQILNSLLSDDFVFQLRNVVDEAFVLPLERQETAKPLGLNDAKLLDVLVDLRLMQIIEGLQSFKCRLDIQALADKEMSAAEFQFKSLWEDNDMDSIYSLLEKVCAFVELIASEAHIESPLSSSNGAMAAAGICEHGLTRRAVENIRAGGS